MFAQWATFSTIVAVVGALSGAEAQRPNLSGTWVAARVELQPRRSKLGTMFKKGDRLTLTQTAEALIVTDATHGRISRYLFDGSESGNLGPDGGTMRTRARWEGLALIVEGSRLLEGSSGTTSVQSRQSWSTSPDLQTLTLVTMSREQSESTSFTVSFSRVAN